jgi:hypothetical protein
MISLAVILTSSALVIHPTDHSSSIATSQKEVPIKSVIIFEVCHQVFRSHKSGYP